MSTETVAPREESARSRALRLLSRQTSRSRLVKVVIAGEELVAEVRSPDLKGRRSMQNQFKDDPAKKNLAGIIDNTFEPGPLNENGEPTPGTKRLFEMADIDTLLSDPSGGFIDVLSSALGEMLKEDMQKADELAKK